MKTQASWSTKVLSTWPGGPSGPEAFQWFTTVKDLLVSVSKTEITVSLGTRRDCEDTSLFSLSKQAQNVLSLSESEASLYYGTVIQMFEVLVSLY